MGFHQNRKERSRRVSRQTLFCHVPMYTNMKVNGFENLTSLSNITPLNREIHRTYPTLWFCLNTKGCDACDLHESRGSINSDQFILLPTRNCFNQVKVIMINYLPTFWLTGPADNNEVNFDDLSLVHFKHSNDGLILFCKSLRKTSVENISLEICLSEDLDDDEEEVLQYGTFPLQKFKRRMNNIVKCANHW